MNDAKVDAKVKELEDAIELYGRCCTAIQSEFECCDCPMFGGCIFEGGYDKANDLTEFVSLANKILLGSLDTDDTTW